MDWKNDFLVNNMLVSFAQTVFRYIVETPSAEANMLHVVCPTESSESQGTELSKERKKERNKERKAGIQTTSQIDRLWCQTPPKDTKL